MTYSLFTRSSVTTTLRELLSGALSDADFRAWLDTAVIGDNADVPDADGPLVAHVISILDGARGAASTLRAAAQDVSRMLEAGLSSGDTSDLLAVVRNRHRILEVLEKVQTGRLSRTAFLSFITEQRWAPHIKRRMSGLSDAHLSGLAESLRSENCRELARLLS